MEIEPAELRAQMAANRAPVILDVRSAAEYADGHIPGAIHFPFWSALFRTASIRVKRDDRVVVYCGKGPRAELAASALRARGLRNVALLRGHIAEWLRAGLPLER